MHQAMGKAFPEKRIASCPRYYAGAKLSLIYKLHPGSSSSPLCMARMDMWA